MDRKYKWKLWTILVLSALIVIGLGYLMHLRRAGGNEPVISENTPVPGTTACPECPEISPEPSAEPSAQPSAEPSTEPSAGPSTEPSAQPSAEPTAKPTPTPTPTPAAPMSDADIDSDDSITRLINISYPVAKTYVPSDLRIVNIPSSSYEYLRAEAADALEEMYQAARDNQVYMRIVDGYRSYSEQLDLYNYYISQHGKAYTEYVDDHPGASEHQLGLAADLGWYNGNCQLNPCIATYPQYQWLLDNSWKYGWIMRYPDGKADVTHITYSPWHFRYVGREEAEKIWRSGLTMEEFYNRPVIKD